MDPIAIAIDVWTHFRIPTGRLVAIVNASFQKLTHRKIGKRHNVFLSGLRLSGAFQAVAYAWPNRRTVKDVSLNRPMPHL